MNLTISSYGSLQFTLQLRLKADIQSFISTEPLEILPLLGLSVWIQASIYAALHDP